MSESGWCEDRPQDCCRSATSWSDPGHMRRSRERRETTGTRGRLSAAPPGCRGCRPRWDRRGHSSPTLLRCTFCHCQLWWRTMAKVGRFMIFYTLVTILAPGCVCCPRQSRCTCHTAHHCTQRETHMEHWHSDH